MQWRMCNTNLQGLLQWPGSLLQATSPTPPILDAFITITCNCIALLIIYRTASITTCPYHIAQIIIPIGWIRVFTVVQPLSPPVLFAWAVVHTTSVPVICWDSGMAVTLYLLTRKAPCYQVFFSDPLLWLADHSRMNPVFSQWLPLLFRLRILWLWSPEVFLYADVIKLIVSIQLIHGIASFMNWDSFKSTLF